MTALRPIKLVPHSSRCGGHQWKIRRAPREERCKILVKTFGSLGAPQWGTPNKHSLFDRILIDKGLIYVVKSVNTVDLKSIGIALWVQVPPQILITNYYLIKSTSSSLKPLVLNLRSKFKIEDLLHCAEGVPHPSRSHALRGAPAKIKDFERPDALAIALSFDSARFDRMRFRWKQGYAIEPSYPKGVN